MFQTIRGLKRLRISNACRAIRESDGPPAVRLSTALVCNVNGALAIAALAGGVLTLGVLSPATTPFLLQLKTLVMLIDEPSNALDISAKNLLADLFKERQLRCVILFSTHDVDFVAATSASVVQLADLIKDSTESVA